MQFGIAKTLGTILVFLACGFLQSASAQSLSTYGTPGLVDLPTAEVLNDGEFALTTSGFGGQYRTTATFQILPRLYGSFRYSVIDGYDPTRNRYDRSFDLHYQFADEGRIRPAMAIGLRDFGGTGIYSSEYIVATKSFGKKLKVTGGLGWGRLAGRNSFSNPLGILGDRFDTRPISNVGGLNTTGQLDAGNWFRGEVSPFLGVSWRLTDQLTLQAEYSPDQYIRESARNTIDITSPLNFAAEYKIKNGLSFKALAIGGESFGAQFSYIFDPAKRRVTGDANGAAASLSSRRSVSQEDWNSPAGHRRQKLEAELEKRFAEQGMLFQGVRQSGAQVHVYLRNDRWDVEAQAAGRAAVVLANTMPAEVEVFTVVFQRNGVPISKVTTRRSDLEKLRFDANGASLSLQRADIEDAYIAGSGGLSFPSFDYSLTPYLALSFFDPESPVRAEFGPQLDVVYRPAKGWSISGTFRYPLVGNVDQSRRVSNSVIEPVRSNALRYAQESNLEINQLTAEYMFRPSENMFGRVTAGYLENMFGGVSAELLWYPINSRLALGAEINFVQQRDFDMLFGFQDYSVATGHVSAYYDIGQGFSAQVDVGRYLAGDWGATFSLDREFNNGFRVGGYFTLTDVSFNDFGEGSFDKGLRIEIPVSWLTGTPSRSRIRQVLRPVLRDGGARLQVNNRLHGFVRDYRGGELQSGWGRYFR